MRNPFRIEENLRTQIEKSGYLHKALPLNLEDSLEKRGLAKKVLCQHILCDMTSGDGWSSQGPGSLERNGRLTPAGNVSMRMCAPTAGTAWPAENPEGDYVPFYRQHAIYTVGGEDWQQYNRLHFWIYPDCEGVYAVNIDLMYENDGETKIPDAFNREGRHEINLVNRQWNECFLEIPELPRDKITRIYFERAVFGRERTMGENWQFDFGEITLQKVENPEPVRGWLPAAGSIAYSMSGYEQKGSKTAIMRAESSAPCKFALLNENGDIAFEGVVQHKTTVHGSFNVLDFSAFETEGRYSLKCGENSTPLFNIGKGVWGSSVWKALNFVFCERCGTPVAGMHGSCHGDIIAQHNGKNLAFCGGWHDAGDLSQQTLQTAFVTHTLLEMLEKAQNCDESINSVLFTSTEGGDKPTSIAGIDAQFRHASYDETLAIRLEEEARWGLDFLLKCRFGDGFYASSAGIVHWSDGYIGNFDDRPARVHNNSFDNLLYAICYATAAMLLKDDEPMRDKLTACAKWDYNYAIERFEKYGQDDASVIWEHSLNTSLAQYMATQSWASSVLYKLTGDENYAQKAAEAIEYTLACQRTIPIGESGICGFFYRDKSQKVIQHYNHQSREGTFMQALQALLQTQPAHANAQKWLAAVKLYGEYLKKIAQYTQPFGMLPSGVYHVNEADDAESMQRQHLQAGGAQTESFKAQLASGIKLDDEHYLRCFPVWFSFRGNSAVHLASGKAAAICAKLLKDAQLRDIATEQLYWVVGKNPFCQSLMYGEGHNYPEQAVFLPGTMTGQLPVGIQTKDNEDVPYWPQANNATYKEAWLSIAGKWFGLVAELTEDFNA